MSDELSSDSRRAAALGVIFASLCFGTMSALVKWASEHADVPMIILVRSAVIAFAVAAFAASRGISLRVNNRKTMFLRCFTGLMSMFLFFTAIAKIPLGQAVVLQKTSPLFIALLSGKVLAERVSPRVALLVITAFAGIVLIVSPDLSSVEPDTLIGLGAGLFAALAMMYVRELRNTDPTPTVVFWFAAACVAGSVVQAAPDLFSLDTKTLAALVGIGICGVGGQVGITMAYQKADATWVSAFSYLSVIVATFYGFTVFGETLSTADWIGGLLIVGSGVAILIMEPAGDEETSQH